MQDHLAIQRSLDTADADLHAVLEFESGNLIGDEALARPRVETKQQGCHQEDEAADDYTGPFRHLASTVVMVADGFRFLGHQNACPIDT